MSSAPKSSYRDLILEHYRKEAEKHGQDASSTMRDEITRGREVTAVLRVVDWLSAREKKLANLVDIGCGNGYLLEVLRERHPQLELTGLEYTPELVEIARERNVERCPVVEGDVRDLPFDDDSFDAVVTERCIINIMDQEDQARSLREVGRILRSGGYYLCIEAFTDGLQQLNQARAELGLLPNEQPYHNIWFDKEWFLQTIAEQFDIVDLDSEDDRSLPVPNFLSSHYFVSRAVYPAVTQAEIVYNSHFVKFLSFLPPIGNYAPIQFWLLQKR
ncbi:class I SAM-dependent methyltransferase [Sphingomonas sp.]|jgi:ubiquinone/menaquinone biosynthesis C-methylase UbiE|uniref:class I SAM-dependent methyltransferase n=1 Tax=Sphingomonas sp. TaxID=28214 RepID=UPI0017A5EBF6|nr:class I SAM-dependent methyltransferase [Sphingomonas sp.]MBA3511191.1 class I SAM-dependent methyltransferase [Sphingomonas sp.]